MSEFTNRPDHDRGWLILNAIGDQLPNDICGDFISDARIFEQLFTSGHISEVRFRFLLSGLLPTELAILANHDSPD